MKRCNRRACQATETEFDNWWWNWSTRAWYCQKCALAINEVGEKCCILEQNLPPPNPEAIKWIESAIRTFHKYADYHLTKDPPDRKKSINNQVEAAALQYAIKLLRGEPVEKECPIHEDNLAPGIGQDLIEGVDPLAMMYEGDD